MRFISGSQRGDAMAIGITGSLLILASFMVWVQVPVVRTRGVEVDGSITAVMGILVVLIAIAALREPTAVLRWVGLVAFSIATYVSFAAFITWSVDGLELDDVGPGLPLAMLVSVVGTALSVMWLRVKPEEVSTYVGGSIDTMATMPRQPGWTVALVVAVGLVAAWQVFSSVVGNAPIGGYGDFSDTPTETLTGIGLPFSWSNVYTIRVFPSACGSKVLVCHSQKFRWNMALQLSERSIAVRQG